MLNSILLQLTPEQTESPNLSDAEASLSSTEASDALEQALMTVSGGDFYSAGETVAEVIDYTTYYDALLASELRQEKQLEGVLSCLLIIVIVGLLKYIYKFFKMFF